MIHSLLAATTTLILGSWGNGAPPLLITVPSGFGVERVAGPDFDVFHISQRQGRASLGVYVGHHPDTQECAQPAGGLPRLQWRAPEPASPSALQAEVLLEGMYAGRPEPGVSALFVHLFIRGSARAEVERLKEAAGTLRVSSGLVKGRTRQRSFTLMARRCKADAKP
jgi:hypothetical protein